MRAEARWGVGACQQSVLHVNEVPLGVGVLPGFEHPPLKPVAAMCEHRQHRQVVIPRRCFDPMQSGIGREQVTCEPADGLTTDATSSVVLGDSQVEQRAFVVEVFQLEQTDHPDRLIALTNPVRGDIVSNDADRRDVCP